MTEPTGATSRTRPGTAIGHRERAARWLRAGVVSAIVVACAGCAPSGWTETAFEREASDAGSTFSAAAEVLAAVHEQRLTRAYLRGAFANFAELVQGVDGELPTLEGHPPAVDGAGLVPLVEDATAALAQPCLDDACDWRSQVDLLRRAADALRDAAER